VLVGGVNGAGKSTFAQDPVSIRELCGLGGAVEQIEIINPDLVTKEILRATPGLALSEAKQPFCKLHLPTRPNYPYTQPASLWHHHRGQGTSESCCLQASGTTTEAPPASTTTERGQGAYKPLAPPPGRHHHRGAYKPLAPPPAGPLASTKTWCDNLDLDRRILGSAFDECCAASTGDDGAPFTDLDVATVWKQFGNLVEGCARAHKLTGNGDAASSIFELEGDRHDAITLEDNVVRVDDTNSVAELPRRMRLQI